eukprot:m.45317 g.45317  ORF g.45317 m.45317 type:complete len:469 (+) comp10663_c0_seq1:39-1445(+)
MSADFVSYAEKHNLFSLFETMVQELVVQQPDDPLDLIADLLKFEQPATIILYGPPAIGKESLAKRIQEKTNTVIVDGGTIAQTLANEGTPAGFIAKEFLEKGKDVPDDVVRKCIVERVNQDDCKLRGWTLIGYPHTREQSIALQMEGVLASHFIHLTAPRDVLAMRASGRVVDGKGNIFHSLLFPPPLDVDVTESPREHFDEQYAFFLKNTSDVLRSFAEYHTCVLNTDQPMDDVCAVLFSFLATQRRSHAPFLPRVTVFGGPGSGKTTQAMNITNKYNAVYVNPQELVTKAISSSSKIGVALQPYLQRGMMIPDNLYTKLVTQRLSEADCASGGWVLDGYPLTRSQADALNKAGFVPNFSVAIDVPRSQLTERITQRRVDPITGLHYHLTSNKPPQEIEERLQQRPTDTEEVVRKRIIEADAFLPELLDFYKKTVTVDGSRSEDVVFESIERHLVLPIDEQADVLLK